MLREARPRRGWQRELQCGAWRKPASWQQGLFRQSRISNRRKTQRAGCCTPKVSLVRHDHPGSVKQRAGYNITRAWLLRTTAPGRGSRQVHEREQLVWRWPEQSCRTGPTSCSRGGQPHWRTRQRVVSVARRALHRTKALLSRNPPKAPPRRAWEHRTGQAGKQRKRTRWNRCRTRLF